MHVNQELYVILIFRGKNNAILFIYEARQLKKLNNFNLTSLVLKPQQNVL